MKKGLKSLTLFVFLGTVLLISYAFGASALLSREEIRANILQSNIELTNYAKEYLDMEYLSRPYEGESYAALNAKAVEITSSCSTDYEKAYTINEWVADNVCYDYDFYYHETHVPSDDAPDVFESGIAVCVGYANLMDAMCRAVGIPSRVISGASFSGYYTLEKMNEIYETQVTDHRWLEVYIDGAWNLCDPTWDSANRYEYGQKKFGTSGDFYFTSSTEVFSKSHFNIYYSDDIKIQDFIFRIQTTEKKIKEYVGEGGIVVFPNLEVTKTERTVFSKCKENVFEAVFPEKMKLVPSYLMNGCSSLKKVTFSSGVEEIGESAFDGCTSLESVNFSSTVSKLGAFCFNNCKSLVTVELPEGLSSVGKDCFSGCSKLESVTVPSTLKEIGEGCFYNCRALKSVVLPEGVEKIGNSAFSGCDFLENVEFPSTLKEIGNYSFMSCKTLEKAELPAALEKIGGNAFTYCSKLVNIELPEKTTLLGRGCFSYCKELKSVTLGSKITEIPEECFSSCSLLETVLGGESVTKIGKSAFWACRKYVGSSFLENLEYLGKTALYGCGSLSGKVKIPLNGNDGQFSFEGCQKLEEVVFEGEFEEIPSRAFAWCSSLKEINIPEGVKKIGEGAFVNCRSLKEIVLSENITSIGASAFNGCSGLKEITVPSAVTEILYHTFYGCSSLEKVTLPEGLESLGLRAFYYCSKLKEIKIPSGVTKIEKECFNGNSALETVYIPLGVTTVETCAFLGDFNLKTVYYGGTQSDWEKIAVAEGNSKLLGAKIIFSDHVHTFSSVVLKEATCLEEGEVKKTCTECGKIFTEKTPLAAHKETSIPAVAATCSKTGLTEGKKCSVCGKITLAQRETPKTAHTFVLASVKDPTCTEEGEAVYRCSACAATKTEKLEKLGHVDADGDRVCDNCSAALETEKCGCICHKGGFEGFIYKIVRIFWKLFKIKKECACGAMHY